MSEDAHVTFVGTDVAAAKLKKLRSRPGMAEQVTQIRADMAAADRSYADSLAAIRRAADLTQVDLAAQMGVAQSEISRIENRRDLLLSTLTSYLASAGENPRVVVTVNGHDVELDLTAFAG